MKNIIIKIFTLQICLISFLISDEVKHNYESAVMPYTKTPNSGRVMVGFDHLNTTKSRAFIGTNEIELGNEELKYKDYTFNAKYHGYNGAGYDFSFTSNKINQARIRAVSAGIYFIWNEIFSNSTPAVVSGKQYTFPTTRILVGLYGQSLDTDSGTSSVGSLKIAMDFIISSKCILTNQFSFDFSDEDKISDDIINSKVILDLNDTFSYGIGIEYLSNKTMLVATNLASLTFDAGIQFKNLNRGYMNYTFKLNPYAKYVLSGKNRSFNQNEVGIKLNVLFN